jgi:hypothetical protein
MMDNTALAERIEPQVAPASETAAIIQMIERAASNPQVDIDKFERLLALRERIDRQAAIAAFNVAVSDAKGEFGPIVKDKEVDFTSQKGRTHYFYEGFDTVAKAVDPVLKRHGLSYRFRAEQNSQRLRVTCILSRGNYCEETTLEAPEDHSGNKNAIQAIGSSATYLQRMTLKLALGIAASKDDDGKGSSGGEPTVSEDQIGELVALIDSVGADKGRFLKFMKVDSLAALPAARFQEAVTALNNRGRA